MFLCIWEVSKESGVIISWHLKFVVMGIMVCTYLAVYFRRYIQKKKIEQKYVIYFVVLEKQGKG